MKTSFIISCFVMAVASTPSIVSAQNLLDLEPKTVFTNNLGPKEIFASKENLDLSAWGDQELLDLKNLSETKPSIFRQELMLLNFNQMTKFLEIVPKEILKPSMELGGVIGNGGGLVTLPSGSSVPADLYVNFSAFSSSIDLPKYYRPFNFADFPGLKEELSDLIALVNRRARQNFIPTDLDQFTIVETPALLGEIGYPVQPGLPFESVAFTYVTSSFDAKTYELRGGQRVIELKVGAMNKMVNNRDRALLLLHEILHHVDASVYSRFPSRYVLISGLVTHLNAILDARQRQLEGDYRPLSSMEKENNEKLQKIINFYTKDDNRVNFFSLGGGISDDVAFSATNFLGLGSSIVLREYPFVVYKAQERKNGNNIILESKFKLGDARNCQGNYFFNVNGEGENPFEFYCYSSASKYLNVFVKKPTAPSEVWTLNTLSTRPITDDQISKYKENGYLLVEGEFNIFEKVVIEQSNNTGMVRVNSSEVRNSTLSNATILYSSKINDSKIKSFNLVKSKVENTVLYNSLPFLPENWDIPNFYKEPKKMENILSLIEIKNSTLYLNQSDKYVLDEYFSYKSKNYYWNAIESSKYTNASKVKISGLKLVLNDQAKIKFESDGDYVLNENDIYERPNKNIFFATVKNPKNPTVSDTVKSSIKTYCDGKSYEQKKFLESINLCVSEN